MVEMIESLGFDVPWRTVVMEIVGAVVGLWACVLVVRERRKARQ